MTDSEKRVLSAIECGDLDITVSGFAGECLNASKRRHWRKGFLFGALLPLAAALFTEWATR